MNTNTKAADLWTGRAASQARYTFNHTPFKSYIKAAIVWLSLIGFITYRIAEYLIQHGGMRHV